eukprot:TRINITY_DN3014_c0_g1_i1.p1 TRINITY_DN3014_c0_g1~~TRINITY_DN3014_c0_g1_i1.p1  ORF type:complete len:590 (+),score=111.53 TRINITY_DN3014_c0_g1_i1:168-1772(+)
MSSDNIKLWAQDVHMKPGHLARVVEQLRNQIEEDEKQTAVNSHLETHKKWKEIKIVSREERSDICASHGKMGICSYQVTGPNFNVMNAVTHSCLTCGGDDRLVCAACVQHCHNGHDLVPLKKSTGFCACGAGHLIITCASRKPQDCCFISKEQDAALKEMFDNMDVDKRGEVSIIELRAFLKTRTTKQQRKITDQEISMAMSLFDADGSGSICYQELVLGMCAYGMPESVLNSTAHILQSIIARNEAKVLSETCCLEIWVGLALKAFVEEVKSGDAGSCGAAFESLIFSDDLGKAVIRLFASKRYSNHPNFSAIVDLLWDRFVTLCAYIAQHSPVTANDVEYIRAAVLPVTLMMGVCLEDFQVTRDALELAGDAISDLWTPMKTAKKEDGSYVKLSCRKGSASSIRIRFHAHSPGEIIGDPFISVSKVSDGLLSGWRVVTPSQVVINRWSQHDIEGVVVFRNQDCNQMMKFRYADKTQHHPSSPVNLPLESTVVVVEHLKQVGPLVVEKRGLLVEGSTFKMSVHTTQEEECVML